MSQARPQSAPQRKGPVSPAKRPSSAMPRLAPVPTERAQYYTKLATPAPRESDAISGMDSEVKECTFTPFISKKSRDRFPAMPAFEDRWRGYVKHLEEARNRTPPLERDCTFKPALSHAFRGASKVKPPTAGESASDWADRMSRYHHRPVAGPDSGSGRAAAAEAERQRGWTFQPQLNCERTKAIQQRRGDDRGFIARYDDDMARRQAAAKQRAEAERRRTGSFKPDIFTSGSGSGAAHGGDGADDGSFSQSTRAGLDAFVRRMDADLDRRQEWFDERNRLLGVTLSDDPSKRRIDVVAMQETVVAGIGSDRAGGGGGGGRAHVRTRPLTATARKVHS